jgi:hypothetical protein
MERKDGLCDASAIGEVIAMRSYPPAYMNFVRDGIQAFLDDESSGDGSGS